MTVSPAPTAGDDEALTVAASVIAKTADSLPSWENDALARYEQPELAAVKADLAICVTSSPKDEDDLLRAGIKLQQDWDALAALDAALSRRMLI